MTWMAQIPRADTTLPWHWVAETARWHNTRVEGGQCIAPGYETACGVLAVPHPDPPDRDVSHESRPTCGRCSDAPRE